MCFANITFINHNQRTIIGRTFCRFCVLVFSHVWTTDHAFSRHNRITLAAMNRSQMHVKQTFREMSILFSYWVSGCSVLIKFLEDVKSWHHEYIYIWWTHLSRMWILQFPYNFYKYYENYKHLNISWFMNNLQWNSRKFKVLFLKAREYVHCTSSRQINVRQLVSHFEMRVLGKKS